MQVFISYRNLPKYVSYTEKLKAWLEERGYTVWLDRYSIERGIAPDSVTWRRAIRNGIKTSRVMLVVYAPECFESDIVVDEWNLGRANGLYVFFLMVEYVPEADRLPGYVDIQYLDMARADAWNLLESDLKKAKDASPKVTSSDPFSEYVRMALEYFFVMGQNLTVDKGVHELELKVAATPEQVQHPLPLKKPVRRPKMGALMLQRYTDLSSDTDEPDEVEIESIEDGMEKLDGRMLLLGEPGAGKTFSLIQYAKKAAEQRLNFSSSAPLPIYMMCATWQSDPPQSLLAWIRENWGGLDNLRESDLSNAVLLLDGFDELGERRVKKVKIKGEDGKEEEREETYDPRPLFLEIIPKTGRVLLSCRSQEYEAFGRKVDLNGAVTLKPLTDAQIAEYLAGMPALWQALQRDGALLEMMRTPLLLSLFAFGYRDAPDALKALEDVEAGELNDVIFRRYVESRYAYEARRLGAMGQQRPFTREEVYAGLGRVAMRNAAGGYGVQGNVLKADDFARVEDLALRDERLRAFTGFAASLHLLVSIEGGAWRFMHLRLRDYFARDHAPQCLKDEWWEVRRAAAAALGAIGDGRAVEPLVAALKDADSDVRSAAAEALEKLGWQPPTQEQRIAYLFAKQDWDNLVAIGTPAVEPLVAALKD